MKNYDVVKNELVECRNLMFLNYLKEDDKDLKRIYLKRMSDLNKILFEEFKVDCYRMLKRGFVNDDGFLIWY